MKRESQHSPKPAGEITTPRLVVGLIDGLGRHLRHRYETTRAGTLPEQMKDILEAGKADDKGH